MQLPNYRKSYDKHVASILRSADEFRAMSDAVGGEFHAVGELEAALLRQFGLQDGQTVYDVGCGSGRLAYQLSSTFDGIYVGLDVVSELLEYAKRIAARPEWKFYKAPGLSIPEEDESADYVCFFSVFTHLLHEESYLYLRDATRVTKPQGTILVSFLEFEVESTWETFRQSVEDRRPEKVLTQFMSRDGLEAMARHCGLDVQAFLDGDKPLIRLEKEVSWEDGRVMRDYGFLGQSICVMRKVS